MSVAIDTKQKWGNGLGLRVSGLMRSVVAASLVQTLSWKERKVTFITKAEAGVLNSVLQRLLPLMGAADFCSR
ncbi:elongation factor GreAB [Thiomicrospira aerophila AL3]|uniref:Elongation factor GreAB n=1 Tax=Thiomicrospira aerophila AL3 TaxID=717772 RepID=W0DS88_9GAMM|nr:elongation factor GreAB [Thiomicrospira aerophila AL3]